jgi:DNA-binding CsgD family transcriptional regulator
LIDRADPTVDSGPVPFKEALDADLDRGVAVFTSELRLAYTNACARAYLADGSARDATTALPPTLRDALSSFRHRVQRSAAAATPAELTYVADGTRRCRVSVSLLALRGARWFVVRFSPTGAFAECNLRRLQSRFSLTLREAEVALAVIRGRTNGEVAEALGISEKTVKNALMHVFAKCNVRNRVELALRALDAPEPGDGQAAKTPLRRGGAAR